jgi:hypothetical protein
MSADHVVTSAGADAGARPPRHQGPRPDVRVVHHRHAGPNTPAAPCIAPHRPGHATIALHRPGHVTIALHRPGLATIALHRPGLATIALRRPAALHRPGLATIALHRPGLATIALHRPGHATIALHRPGLATIALHRPGLATIALNRPGCVTIALRRPGCVTVALNVALMCGACAFRDPRPLTVRRPAPSRRRPAAGRSRHLLAPAWSRARRYRSPTLPLPVAPGSRTHLQYSRSPGLKTLILKP